jgi:sterol 14-demethylase
MLKSGLNIAHFKQHVSIIEKETKEYFESWGESGEKSKQNFCICYSFCD